MTPGARIQASIELIDQILSAWLQAQRIPADKLFERYFKSHRYIGSKDRGVIAELTYWVLRHKTALEWWLDKYEQRLHGRSYIIAALLLRRDYTPTSILSVPKDSQYSPPPFEADETAMIDQLSRESIAHPDMPMHVKLNYPLYAHDLLVERFGEQLEDAMRSLNEQAPMDLRVNTLKTTRDALQKALHKEEFETTETPLSPIGLRLEKRAPIFTSEYFKQGHFEVQDAGSQALALLVDAKPGHKVIDFCAGAGGKALAMAACMENKGRILAWDVSEKRLDQMKLRLKRAGVSNVQLHAIASESDAFIKRHKASADRVLIDVPCSGSGTWRRNPDLKWRFTKEDLREVMEVQQRIVKSAARLVKPGGRLIYATCSIFNCENDQQITSFLNESNNFTVVCAKKIWDKTLPIDQDNTDSFFRLTPHKDGVDGFFAAVLERTE